MKDKFYNFFVTLGEYSLYGMVFFVAISNGMLELFAGLAILGFVGRKIIKPDFKFLKSWPNTFLILFFMFSALSLLNSGKHFNISLHALLGKWMQYLLIYIAVQDSIHEQKIIKRGMFVFLFGASLTVLSGLSQYFFGVEFLANQGALNIHGGMHAVTSSFHHYNDFGSYLVVALSFAAALLIAKDPSGLKSAYLLIPFIFSMLTLCLTFSRASWLAMFVSFVFITTLSKKYSRLLIPVIFIVIVLFLFPTVRERLFYTFQAGGDSERFIKWSAVLKMIHEHPFLGTGVGTFMANFSKFLPGEGPAYAHNCYLQIWAETGIFGLMSFIAFVASLFYLGTKKFIISKDFVLLGLLAGALGFLVHSFFDTDLYSLRLVILFWVWLGLLVARLRRT